MDEDASAGAGECRRSTRPGHTERIRERRQTASPWKNSSPFAAPGDSTHDCPRCLDRQDPQPGDFGADLDDIDSRHLETHTSDPDIKVTVIATAEDDAADRR
jgi:hypothetical protein